MRTLTKDWCKDFHLAIQSVGQKPLLTFTIFFLHKITSPELIFQVFFQAMYLVHLLHSSSPEGDWDRDWAIWPLMSRREKLWLNFFWCFNTSFLPPLLAWTSRGGVKTAPPQLTREVAVSDGGQGYENPQLMCAWVGGETMDEAPQQISACDIPAAPRESLAAPPTGLRFLSLF